MRRYLFIIPIIVLLASCANRGVGPQGGPKDTIPPVPLQSVPEQGALNFQGKRIEVSFNEYLQLDNIASNLLMSPPQQTPPDVKARGKKLIVTFQDTLRTNTTYTIDFGDAVCDYHEKVPLHGFSFYFSTGPEIDTLETCGYVYDAENLNPIQGILAGIHDNLADSAFSTLPFLRIAKTDSTGFFRIGNMHNGTYRVYGVDDVSRDYRLTVSEALAFTEQPVEPGDTATLFLFKEAQQRLYLQRTLRDVQHRITLLFSSSPDSVMSFRALRPSEMDSAKSDSSWTDPTPFIYTQVSAHGDTVTLWLTDSIAITQDSLFLEARYRRTDSLFNLEWYTDTLRAIWRAPKLSAKAQEAQDRKNRNRRLELKSNARKNFELFDTLRLGCTTPLASIELDSMHLYEVIDTVRKNIQFTLAPHDTLPMQISFIADFKANGSYELCIDSGALHDVYGVTHIAGNYPFKLKIPEDYSTLRVKITPFVPHAMIQVLDGKDKVVRTLPADADGAFFEYLKPDTYYLRLFMDENGDGKWTTGSWEDKRQPEAVYYFPESIQTKSNWDFEEEWDYTAVPQTQAKPSALIKAAPKKKK